MTTIDRTAAGVPAPPRRAPSPGRPAGAEPVGSEPVGGEPAGRGRSAPPRLALALLLTDLLACALAVVLPAPHAGAVLAAFAAGLLTMLGLAGLHRSRLGLSVLDDLPVLLMAALAALGAVALTGAVVPALAVGPAEARATAVLTAVLGLARVGAYALVRRARRTGAISHPTLIVGCGGLGAQLAGVLATHQHGLRPIGFVDDAPRLPAGARSLPLLGRLADLPALIREHRVAVVVVGYSNAPESVVVDVIRTCDRLPVEIYTVPRFWQVHSTHRRAEVLGGVPLVRLRRPAFRAPSWPLKRVVDVVVAAAALALTAPVLAGCALAVRLESGPGVLFRQERVGLDGRRFQLLKLRSLAPAADEGAVRWSIAHDERLGPVGRWMRRLSLDELPQLWNVLRGDMSLVGPRPERPHFVERFSRDHEEYLWRHRVPCGITGWAQVHGLRGDTSISERARFDNHYIENWSLWLDVKILLRTARQVISAAGG